MNYDRLVKRLMVDEGYREESYWDDAWGGGKGQWSWGYGTKAAGPGKRISKFAAKVDLESKVNYFTMVFQRLFEDVKIDNEIRQEALLNMMYNLGVTRFLGFKKMIEAVRQNNWEEAALEAQNSLWYEQVPGRARRIVAELKTGEENFPE